MNTHCILENNTISALNFLNIIIVLYVCRRRPLFLGHTCIEGYNVVMSAKYLKWVRRVKYTCVYVLCMYTYRERCKTYIAKF